MSFSFRYLREDHEFGFAHCPQDWLQSFIERLAALCSYTREELEMNLEGKALRSHAITWSDTSRNGFGFPKEDELVEKPWELMVSKATGRFHGFFIGDVFCVVWLDPKHLLYP